MAQLAPFGFQAGQSRRSVNEYYVPASDTSTLAVGDPVRTDGNVFVGRLPDSRVSKGMLHVTKAAPGQAVRGVIVGIVAGPDANNQQSLPAAKTRPYCLLVNDNPQALWDVQADNAAPLTAMAGMYASYAVGAPLGSVSSTVVDSSTIGATVSDLLIAEVLRNDGANTLLRVAFVQHEMAAAGGSPQIGAQIQSLVSGAVIPQQLTPELLTDCVIGQLPDGRFVGWGDNDNSGDIRLWVSTAYSGGTITRINASVTQTGAGGLQDTAGVEVGGASAGWINAWTTSNGDILALMQASAAARYHLYRIKPTNGSLGAVNTIGSDVNYSNKKAVLDVGRLPQVTGTHVVGIRALAGHSFCEATIAGAKVYLFAEYNIAAGRVNGAANDQAVVWKSTDAGATWTQLLTFNTDGSNNQFAHFHGVLQDPMTGWIYFLTGDVAPKNAIIAWDGVSTAPAANASWATIAATPGWKVQSGDELRRYTTLLFGPAGIYSMPDADTETAEATTTAYVGTAMPRTLDYVATIAAAPRVDNIAPVMGVRSPAGWAAIASFRTSGPQEQYLHVWLQDDPNGYAPWRLAAKVYNYRTITGTPAKFWIGTDGALYLAGKYGSGIQFTSAVKSGTTIRFTPSLGPGQTVTYVGA